MSVVAGSFDHRGVTVNAAPSAAAAHAPAGPTMPFDQVTYHSVGARKVVDNALSEQIRDQLLIRASARQNHDWATADRIRDELRAGGVEIYDKEHTWKVRHPEISRDVRREN